MRVIALSTLRDFWLAHADASAPLRAWYVEAKRARWNGPVDIKARYSTASFVGSERVVLNIKSNRYRLIVKVRYDKGIVYVRFVGTHAESTLSTPQPSEEAAWSFA